MPVDANDVAALPQRAAAVATGLGGLRMILVQPTNRGGSELAGQLDLGQSVVRVQASGSTVFASDATNALHIVIR